MPKFFINQEQMQENKIVIKGQDVNHIKKVLRAKIGEELEICNTTTNKNYLCNITKMENEEIECIIKQELETQAESKIQVTIFQGIPKADKMEYIIQKSVEIGGYDITPVEMKRCVVKLDEKDKIKKVTRWQKISEVAAKQCGRDIIPKVNNIINVKKLCELIQNYDIVLLAYENEKENTLKQQLKKLEQKDETIKIGIVIGPEGGIEEQEVNNLKENGAQVITLGKRILRTETVALNVLSIIMYELEN